MIAVSSHRWDEFNQCCVLHNNIVAVPRKRHIVTNVTSKDSDQKEHHAMWSESTQFVVSARQDPKIVDCTKPEPDGTRQMFRLIRVIAIYAFHNILFHMLHFTWFFSSSAPRFIWTTPNCYDDCKILFFCSDMKSHWSVRWSRKTAACERSMLSISAKMES